MGIAIMIDAIMIFYGLCTCYLAMSIEDVAGEGSICWTPRLMMERHSVDVQWI